MNYEKGILNIAFGRAYERLAAHCLAYSRKFTNIPICVLTNIKDRCDKWNEVTNVEFIEFDMPDDLNRDVKTRCIDYTPFEKTLYLDCDTIVQKSGIENVFDMIEPDRLLVCLYGRFCEAGTKYHYHYWTAVQNIPIEFPLDVYFGAFIGFSKNNAVWDFFGLWNKYWKMNTGREMPSLAIAIRKSNIRVNVVKIQNNIFAWKLNSNAIIQHEQQTYVRNLVGCSDFKAYKPFDKRS